MLDAQNEEIFVLTDDDGNEQTFVEMFSFDSEDTGKSYIVLAPDVDTGEDVTVLPYIYNPNDENDMLQPVETQEEFDMIEEVMNTLFADGHI